VSLSLAQNVAMTRSGVAVATSSAGGLLVRVGEAETLVDPPQDISAFTDVSMDAQNESLVFALSVSPPRICSYTLVEESTVTSVTLVNCVGSTFAVSPFCGISALGGTLVISGGTGGVSVFDYNTQSGLLQDTARVENFSLQVIGNPDVVMVTPAQAALSSDIGGSPRFGTIILEIDDTLLTPVGEFRNPNSSGFDNTISPSNFPFVNAVFMENESTWLYTAHGGMTVQNVNVDGGTVEIAAPEDGFQAVTVSVNPIEKKVVFGGLLNGGSIIYAYNIVDPTTVTLMGVMQVGGRITSVATSNGVVSYVEEGGSTIESFELNSMATQPPSSPTATPAGNPTLTSSAPAGTPTLTSSAPAVSAVAWTLISVCCCVWTVNHSTM